MAAPTKYASAYLFPDRLVLHSETQTDFGNFARGPYQTLPINPEPAALATAILAALEASVIQSPMPANVRDLMRPHLEGLGAKTQSQLQRTSKNVGIERADTHITFHPTHNGGTAGDRKGFQPIPDSALRVPANASPADLAAAFLHALSRSTSIYPWPPP